MILDTLGLGHVSQTTDSRSNGGSGGSQNRVGTTSDGLVTGLAVPDTSGQSVDSTLTAEGAVVLCVLLDFQLFGLSPQRGTISDTKLSGDSDLFRSLGPVWS